MRPRSVSSGSDSQVCGIVVTQRLKGGAFHVAERAGAAAVAAATGTGAGTWR